MTDSSVTQTPPPAPATPPAKDYGRAGRNLPAAIGSAVVLLGAAALSLLFVKTFFMIIVVLAVIAATWELHRGLMNKKMDVPEQPLVIGGAAMVLVAYFLGADALVTATAVSALVIMLWVLRRGVEGYVRTSAASVLTLFYVPFLGAFVGLMLSEGGGITAGGLGDDGVRAIIVWVLVTVASDIGGYVAGVLFGKHPMAPVISPKKSWEGFAGSMIFTVATGILLVEWLLDGNWWVGAVIGVVTCMMAVLGDLVESVIKRDLGVKDMSHIIPGHGGIMDRLDSLLATVAPVWLLMHYALF